MSFSNFTSRLFGVVAKFKFYKPLQKVINESYVSYFNINLSDFKSAYEYESLNALFTRKFTKDIEFQDDFVAPSDGKIYQSGSSFLANDEAFAFSIKGHTYSIEELLRDNFEKNELEKGLDYVNIYLSPSNYHRYHVPFDMQILQAVYTRGSLFSVNEKYLKKISNLYTKNERVSLKCKCNNFIFWLVFVGAQNVGKMRFNFDENIQTNAKNSHDFSYNYENLYIKKGDELGYFELGSTIVLIVQKDYLKFNVKENDNIKVGQKIASFL
ncbi:phosphatidylserine decarboxylase [Campylobacter sp. LR264d]|uniref:phosphatidylserine decarboxylase n=1 Tax=Campylobacter sp. LR264d TaxID=2593544 RepID=UPI00123941CF|nr:phosphatidylserine decarboxylase [Campylobacter sp. LR264d]KAA6230535.1 phosphatidylserine decarboxylase [Campylobacter sp. LR264d]